MPMAPPPKRSEGPTKPRLNTHGRDGLLGLAPPPHDPLPPVPPRLAAVLALLAPPPRLEIRVRTVPALRAWLAAASRGWRATYYRGPEPLAGGRLHDSAAGPLGDEALKQSTAKDVPQRSRMSPDQGPSAGCQGQGRTSLHTENSTLGSG
jgi:hypothetical protein